MSVSSTQASSLTLADLDNAYRQMNPLEQDMHRAHERQQHERMEHRLRVEERRMREAQTRGWTVTDPAGSGDHAHVQITDGLQADMMFVDEAAAVPEPEPTFDNLGDMLLYKYNGVRYGVGKRPSARIEPKRKRKRKLHTGYADLASLVRSV